MIAGNASVRLLLAVLLTAAAASADEPANGKKARSWGWVARGRVVDARDGQPVARFRVIPRSFHVNGQPGMWQPHLLKKFEGGQGHYEFREDRPWRLTQLRVEADGYRPAISRQVKDSEGEITIDFALKRDPGLPGMVRNAEGAPVAGARVMFATESRSASVRGGRLEAGGMSDRLGAVVAETGPDGTFRVPAELDPGTIVAVHERQGYAEVAPEVLAATGDVTLRPWGRVEGRVLAGDSPVAGRLVVLGSSRPFRSQTTFCFLSDETTTDAAGRFIFDRVAPGQAHINRATRTEHGWHSLMGSGSWIDVVERGTTRIILGGPGCVVTGRLKPPAGVTKPINWSKFSYRLFPDAPHVGLHGDDEDWKAYGQFARSAEGQRYFREKQAVQADGTFRLDGVPQGQFTLQIWTTADPEKGDQTVFAAVRRIEVPAAPDGRGEPIDLGAVTIDDNAVPVE